MSASPPAIAVVVPTFRRAGLLPRLVAALEGQDADFAFEVVIVDNGSPDDTSAVLNALAARTPLALRPERVAVNHGPAGGRNAGWRAATAPLVVFTDDDCVPTPSWLREIVAAAATADIVIGRTQPDPDQCGELGPFARTMDVSRETGYFETCNVAYPRALLERLDGFDASLAAGGEDTDLGWRAVASGATSTYAGDAVVRHDVRPSSWLAAVKDTWRWHTVPKTVRKHPGLRDELYARVFWRRTHASALGVVAGALLIGHQPRRPRSWVLAAGLAAPYVRDRLVVSPLPHTSRRERLALTPATLVIDLAEIVVCARGSIRDRTFVL